MCSSTASSAGRLAWMSEIRAYFMPSAFGRGRRPPSPVPLEDAETFLERLGLVGREIDDAIGDDHVHRLSGERDGLDLSPEEFHVLRSRFSLVLPGQLEHLVCHV